MNSILRPLLLGALALPAACGAADAALTAAGGHRSLAAATQVALVSQASGLALEVAGGSVTSGTPVVLAAASGAAQQQWRLVSLHDDVYQLVNVATGKLLDVAQASRRDGGPVLQWEDKSGANQQWRASQQDDGTYLLVSVNSGKCLDAPYGQGAGTQVVQWGCHGGSNQRWQAVAAAPSGQRPATTGTAASTTAPAPPAPPADGGYSVAALRQDIAQVLQSRQGVYSGRPLGNPANVALWDDDHVTRLYRGLTAALPFFAGLSLADFAHLVLAEGAQESTGDYRLQGDAVGFMQVTVRYAVQDYRSHGTALRAADGTPVIDPAGSIDPTDPGQSVAIWAWYTHNAVASGESAGEVAGGLHRGLVTRDYGNAQLAWLTGPGHDRHSGNSSYTDYHDRVKDYFVQAGFGTAERFEALLGTAVSNTVMAFRDPPASGLEF